MRVFEVRNFTSSPFKRNSTSPVAPSSTLTSNSSMSFSVTDILQPFDVDTSASYKRSIEMAQALTAASSSSSAYPLPRPTSNTAFGSAHSSSYYGPSSNNQYYDYNGNPTGQYSPSSCWYGSAASRCEEFPHSRERNRLSVF